MQAAPPCRVVACNRSACCGVAHCSYLKTLGRRFTLRKCKQLAIHVLSALEYLAAHGIIHRDLKPENILVFIDEYDGHVTYKVGDVGLARFAANRSASRMTVGAGTQLYRAPEVASIRSRYDAKVDVYSFGIIMTEVIACTVMPDSKYARTGYTATEAFPDMIDAVLAYLRGVGCDDLASVIDECVIDAPALRLTATAALARIRASGDAVVRCATDAAGVDGVVHAVFTVQMPIVVPPVRVADLAPFPPRSPAAQSAVIDVFELLDTLKLKGLEEYRDAVADAIVQQRAVGVPRAQVYDVVKAAGVGAMAALDFAEFVASCEYKTAAAAAASAVVCVIIPL